MDYKKYLREPKWIVLLVGLFAFFIRAIPHQYIIPFVGIEEGGMFLSARRITSGYVKDIGLYPHTAIFGVVALHKLTGQSLFFWGRLWSPIMGGLSTVVMYYVLRDVFNIREPIHGTILFASLDAHIYRSTMFGTGAEATGILFLLMFVYLYHEWSRVWSVVLLSPIIALTHLIVFGVLCIWVVSDLILSVGRRSLLYITGLMVMVASVALFFFSPYGLAFLNIRFILGFFDPNIVAKIAGEDFVTLFTTLLGTLILFTIGLFTGERRSQLVLSSVALVVVGVLSLFWYSLMISPLRVLVYAGILGVVGFSRWEQGRSGKYSFAVLLAIVMLCQVSWFGWAEHNRIYDAVTEEELDMVFWIRDNVDISPYSYGHFYWDDAGAEALLFLLAPIDIDRHNGTYVEIGMWYYKPQLEEVEEVEEGEEGEEGEHGYVANVSSGDYVRFRWVIYSDRFSRRALFRFTGRGNRVLYRNYAIVDIWEEDPNWVVIYENEGGKIYERQS